MNSLAQYWRDEDGLTSVEHAILIMLVTIAAITAWGSVGSGIVTTAEQGAGAFDTSSDTGNTGSGGCERS